ncbi:DUF2207 domain-containing protein [Entomohabitans teleogrylli]|uniref:DUF2207 domain-containing protein n=1 Tax=Entomohabitans teleogrylli TaxID=1384589 RepID=UPI00073D8729|nr:DUF2207 domain-containing protein [Entomohabitans teleogrylli]
MLNSRALWRAVILLWVISFILCSVARAQSREATANSAQEAITLFDVQATMLPDGMMDVVERISLQVRNRQINHGFWRSLPLRWVRPDRKSAFLHYQVVEVLRNGQPEPWAVRHRGAHLEIIIGDAGRLLEYGDHQYQIRYRIGNHFLRARGSDVLLWNVTGNDWAFPIYKARFTLHLPDAVAWRNSEGRDTRIGGIEFFTGRYGEKGLRGQVLADGRVESQAPLRYREGLTVLYSWPLSVLPAATAPKTTSLFGHLLIPSSWHSLLPWLPCGLLALLCVGFATRWPRYTPCEAPRVKGIADEFSPGFLRLAHFGVYDEKAFCADIVNLIIKKVIELRKVAGDDQKQYLVLSQWQPAALTLEERYLKDLLFGKTATLALYGKRNKSVRKAFLKMAQYDEQRRKGDVYRNGWFILLAAGASLAAIIIAFCTTDGCDGRDILKDILGWLFFMLPLGFCAFFLSVRRDEKKSLYGPLLRLIFIPLASFVFYILLSNKLNDGDGHYWYMSAGYYGALMLSGYLGSLFYALMPFYTQQGQARAARARGVAHWLISQEKLARKGKTLDESLLPWAVAIDSGSLWVRHLQRQLSAAISVPEIVRAGSLTLLMHNCRVHGSLPASFGGGSSVGGSFSGGGSGGGGGGGW